MSGARSTATKCSSQHPGKSTCSASCNVKPNPRGQPPRHRGRTARDPAHAGGRGGQRVHHAVRARQAARDLPSHRGLTRRERAALRVALQGRRRRGVGGRTGALGVRTGARRDPRSRASRSRSRKISSRCSSEAIQARSRAAGLSTTSRCPGCRPACPRSCSSAAPTSCRRSRISWPPTPTSVRRKRCTFPRSRSRARPARSARDGASSSPATHARLEFRAHHQRADLHRRRHPRAGRAGRGAPAASALPVPAGDPDGISRNGRRVGRAAQAARATHRARRVG